MWTTHTNWARSSSRKKSHGGNSELPESSTSTRISVPSSYGEPRSQSDILKSPHCILSLTTVSHLTLKCCSQRLYGDWKGIEPCGETGVFQGIWRIHNVTPTQENGDWTLHQPRTHPSPVTQTNWEENTENLKSFFLKSAVTKNLTFQKKLRFWFTRTKSTNEEEAFIKLEQSKPFINQMKWNKLNWYQQDGNSIIKTVGITKGSLQDGMTWL